MDVRFINPFLEAVQHVFKTMMATDSVFSKPFIKGPNDNNNADIFAVIDLSGDAKGMVVLGFPETTATKIAAALTGKQVSLKHPDLGDALGEVLNMVTGHAKSLFEGLHCDISVPKIFVAKDLHIMDSRGHTLALPCDSSLGRFRLEITLQSGTNPSIPLQNTTAA